MSSAHPTSWVGAVLGSLLILAAAPAAACDSRQPIHVAATRAPLSKVIEDIAAQCNFSVVSTADLAEPVSIDYSQWSAAETLRRLLRSHSYVLESDDDGRPLRLRLLGGEETRRSVADDPLARVRLDLNDTDPDVRTDAVLALIEATAEPQHERLLLLETAKFDSDASVRAAAETVLDDLQPDE